MTRRRIGIGVRAGRRMRRIRCPAQPVPVLRLSSPSRRMLHADPRMGSHVKAHNLGKHQDAVKDTGHCLLTLEIAIVALTPAIVEAPQRTVAQAANPATAPALVLR